MIKPTILVVTHKPYILPSLSEIYQYIQVGTAQKIYGVILRDNTGDNIAERNNTYCELTALYWAWKNLDTAVLGLCHYRRLFGSPALFLSRFQREKKDQILACSQITKLLKKYDVIVPKKRHYWIETRESQYVHAHHVEDLKCVEGVILERYPEYLPSWKWMLGTRSGHICNMFIMRQELVNDYCTWLFDILFEAEKRLDISLYSDKDKRVFGYLGERLLDVWIRKNSLRYMEVPMITLENQHWIRKGVEFVKRKIKPR